MRSGAKSRPRLSRAVREILVFGLCGGLLITVLRLTEYRFLVLEHSVEIYGGLVAVIFAISELGITPRELEILGLIAAGLSNREIADRLFVSENTVKTHSSRLFDKLGARRRTQAVQLGKQAHLIP